MSLKLVLRFLMATTALVGAPLVMAGTPMAAAVVYAPSIAGLNNQPVPSLSEWGLITLCMLVLAIAYRMMRSGAGARPVATVLLAGALGASVISGSDLVGSAVALPYAIEAFSNANGGTTNVLLGETRIQNISGVPQKIISITLEDDFFELSPAGSPQREVNTVLASNATCFLHFELPR